MARYKLLHGKHVVSDENQRIVTYSAGDIIESDKDLCAIHNRPEPSHGPTLQRFELVPDEQPTA